MKNKYKIELGFDELFLIERALELYGRVGMLQFDTLNLNTGLSKLIWDKNISREFRDKADELKALFNYAKNSNPGIFNIEEVGDDSRIAIDIYQQIRHQRFLDRMKSGEQKEKCHTVDEYPADICRIAGMALPDFKIINNE